MEAIGNIVFASVDDRFCLRLSSDQVDRMRNLCAAAKRNETGGILIGYYTEDRRTAIVTEVTAAPSDSRSGLARFYRGVRGLRAYLVSLWKSKRYYLGEWHFHPFSTPAPSTTDRAQLREIASDVSYCCPEPILVIFGGDPNSAWLLSAHLFLRRGPEEELRIVPSTVPNEVAGDLNQTQIESTSGEDKDK